MAKAKLDSERHVSLSELDKKKQWHEFISRLELLGKRILDAQKEYENLATTRCR